MRRRSLGTAVLASSIVALAVGAAALAGGRPTDGSALPAVDTGSALVQLKGDPLATYEKTRPPKGKKIDFSSNAVRSYRAQLNQLRNEFKRWLRENAPEASVVGEFDVALNAVSVRLNGTPLSRIAAAPMVQHAEYERLYRPAGHEDPDLALVHAFEAWVAGGGTGAAKGEGVKVAIVDTGIDTSHPCFQDGGPVERNGETNSKVVFAGVFHMQARSRGFTPADLNGHGTHVAGTVACNEHTDTVLDGVVIPYKVSGVAPAATLGNFNVFPDEVASARSEDIVDALEEAYEQGFDVANMSLGGPQGGIKDLLSMAVDNLDAANMVVAVAAGNEGPGFSTVSSPGIAPGALTAGAATVGHFVGAPMTVDSTVYQLATGDFETVDSDLTRELEVVADPQGPGGLSTACSALPAGSLANRIALISRGVCTFSTKIRNAQNAGAAAVVVVNNVGGDPIAMAQDGTPNQPTVPAYMVGISARSALAAADGRPATIASSLQYFRTGNDNIMAGFSSQGPTDVDFRVKPDAVAPGVNVLSAQPARISIGGELTPVCETPPCWAFFQGTSMATPHLAGIAALVRGQHPEWSAAEVRSAIVNTADQSVLLNSAATALQRNVNVIGAGRANALSAVGAKVALDPVSVSFGAVPSGSGRVDSRTIALSTLSGSGPYTVSVTDETGSGVDFGASISGSTITVTMNADKGIAPGSQQGILRVFAGGTEIAHAAVYAFVK
ncbi:MAG TPA: S8 family serine peptidase [Gaiellaceae bacterium]|nr:S8 family serine peptidase [Gaiellaceae bacterium]